MHFIESKNKDIYEGQQELIYVSPQLLLENRWSGVYFYICSSSKNSVARPIALRRAVIVQRTVWRGNLRVCQTNSRQACV